jgi:hypothetical protein
MSDKNHTNKEQNDYKPIQTTKPTMVLANSQPGDKGAFEKPSWITRKYRKIRKALGEFWVVGRYGFQLGGVAGLILGFFVGGYESVRMKSFWPLPIAMLGSGFTFGCIFAISTVLRSHNIDGENKLLWEVIYYDEKNNKYIKAAYPFNEKEFYFKNTKI